MGASDQKLHTFSASLKLQNGKSGKRCPPSLTISMKVARIQVAGATARARHAPRSRSTEPKRTSIGGYCCATDLLPVFFMR